MFAIEVVEEIQIAHALEFSKDDVIVVDDLFEGSIGPVEGVSDFVNLLISFDVLSRFVSHSDDVHDSSFMNLSIFSTYPSLVISLYLHHLHPHHIYLI